MTKLLTQPGDTLTEGFGPTMANPILHITTTLHVAGIAFHVSDGVQRVAELCRTFTNREHAAGYYRHLRDAALAGKRIYQIVAEAQALVELMNVDAARSVDEIAGALNAEVKTHHARVVAVHNQTVAAVAEVMAGAKQTGGWNGARKRAQQAVTPIGRKVRPTRTRVHCKPPTPAQYHRMRQHRDGVVTCGHGQPWTLLEGIVQRGHADEASITYWPGTLKIRSVRLNTRGLEYVGQNEPVAA